METAAATMAVTIIAAQTWSFHCLSGLSLLRSVWQEDNFMDFFDERHVTIMRSIQEITKAKRKPRKV